MSLPSRMLQLRSLITTDGQLRLSLVDVPIPKPAEGEVLVRIEATPINPSDLMLLLGMADMTEAVVASEGGLPMVSAPVSQGAMNAQRARLDKALPVGNEGAGVVVAAGPSEAAQALLGRTVGMIGGEMYSQYRVVKHQMCLPLNDGTTPREGASCFVNPLTALGMVETMRREGHRALVHTAAASNLGQMLNKVCLAEGVDLVNIVRRPEQEDVLRDIGARYICSTAAKDFMRNLTKALVSTGATLAFDATGGGDLTGRILSCMESAVNRDVEAYSRYGSDVHKQVYIYGGLDISPTILKRNFGFAWGIGGWLLTPFLQQVGVETMLAMRRRVANEIKTTFRSDYTREISLSEVLSLESIAEYSAQSTGHKYLINPQI